MKSVRMEFPMDPNQISMFSACSPQSAAYLPTVCVRKIAHMYMRMSVKRPVQATCRNADMKASSMMPRGRNIRKSRMILRTRSKRMDRMSRVIQLRLELPAIYGSTQRSKTVLSTKKQSNQFAGRLKYPQTVQCHMRISISIRKASAKMFSSSKKLSSPQSASRPKHKAFREMTMPMTVLKLLPSTFVMKLPLSLSNAPLKSTASSFAVPAKPSE
mmetsp:Transcript_13210/g.23367  ORF Transcript_13210/g.23367 Transcript_13210/m.23367 type:complete len:215 (-) Transcript_13210:158-802(-)